MDISVSLSCDPDGGNRFVIDLLQESSVSGEVFVIEVYDEVHQVERWRQNVNWLGTPWVTDPLPDSYNYITSVTGQSSGESQSRMLGADCGSTIPQHPVDGTFIRNECNGVNLQQVVADGNGGERWGAVVEYNSAQCGYVPPQPEPEPEPVVLGCTDPTAENYNPLATQDDGTCAYAPMVFTEVKTVEVLPCAEGVSLRWFNSLGGIDTWLFQGKVDRPFASEASGEFSHASGLLGAASKSGQPSMVLRAANLNYNRYQALWQLYTSPKVWIHHEDGTAEEVYVQPSTLPAMPLGRNSYDITVEITKAPINTLRK